MAYTPEQIQQGMKAARAAGDEGAYAQLRGMLTAAYQSEVKSPVEEMGGLERFAAGMGQGAVNVGRQLSRAGNQLTGGRVGMSAEDLAQRSQLDAPLLQTGAGRAGSIVGEIAATAPVGGLAGAAAKQGLTRAGLTGAGRMAGTLGGAGAVQGAAEGALMADEGQRLKGAGVGAAGGALIPVAGKKLVRALSRGVEASAPARALMREGVDLTPGQMNPQSSIGQMEEAATNLWGVGPAISRARESAVKDWQRAVARKSGAPGTKPGTLDEAFASFEPAYDKAKGVPVFPKNFDTGQPLASFPKVRGLFGDAVSDRNVIADRGTRNTIDSWLQNKLTQLPGAGRGTTTPMDSAQLLKLRSDIRTQIRKVSSGKTPNTAQADLLRGAEERLTGLLESQFDDATKAGLRATDQQYAQYKIFEDAVGRAGDQLEGLKPSQLSQAVRAATEPGSYARGAGGPLRKLAGSGKQVFDARTPPTGARLATLGGLAYLVGAKPAAAIAGLTTLAATTKGGRKLLGGATAAQRRARALELALRKNAGNVIMPTSIAAGSTAARDFTGD